MFGLSTKEILFKSIVNACRNCENTYKNSIIEKMLIDLTQQAAIS